MCALGRAELRRSQNVTRGSRGPARCIITIHYNSLHRKTLRDTAAPTLLDIVGSIFGKNHTQINANTLIFYNRFCHIAVCFGVCVVASFVDVSGACMRGTRNTVKNYDTSSLSIVSRFY